jgi:thiamine biosynthesis lipoprotein
VALGTRAVAALIVLPIVLASCATSRQLVVIEGEGLGATWTVKIAGPLPQEAASVQRGIQARVDDVARHLSRWDSSSSVSLLNAATESDWQPVAPELLGPMSYALQLASDTGGAFDPTVAPLVDAWGFGTAGRRYEPPRAEAIDAARARVGHTKLTLDAREHRLRKPAGMQIDLSSMTHGLAADQVAAYLDSIGVANYLVDVGSELRAKGKSPEKAAWRVAIERPPTETSAGPPEPGALRSVSLRNAGIATSGNYRYYFDYNGKRYSHRIDPRTGEPVSHDLASVTVIDPKCMHADALATALSVLGPDEGLKYATSRNIAALFVVRSGEGTLVEHMTPGFATYLNTHLN